MAQGAGLPPKIIEKSYQWGSHVKVLSQKKASDFLILNDEPLDHGLLENLQSSRAQWRIFGSSLAYNPTKNFNNPSGIFEVEGSKLRLLQAGVGSRALYSVDMGFSPLIVKEFHGGIRAFRSHPKPVFFYLNRFASRAYRVLWSDDSQIVDFVPCSQSEKLFLLVENVRNGLTRFVFFDADFQAREYTIFDLGRKSGLSDVSRVLATKDCREILLGGTFGIARVRYP